MTFYGMITTAKSRGYTPLALRSFFANTPLLPEDRFFLVDNDGDFDPRDLPSGPQVEILTNKTPVSFSANVNQVMERARSEKADPFFLNNDLVFSPNWSNPFQSAHSNSAILSPVSNREIQYQTKGFHFKNVLSLEDFNNHLPDFEELLRIHHSRKLTPAQVIFLPFFCVKIPYPVYAAVGELDETFGRGGGEDNDYCVRAVLAGFKIAYLMQSFVLHFNGKSTWEVEGTKATEARCKLFTERFREKWGEQLTRLSIQNDTSVLQRPEIQEKLRNGDLRGVIQSVAVLDSIQL